MEEGEPDRLLELSVAVDLDVGAVPEVVEVRALVGDESVPALVASAGERAADLVADRRAGSARPTSRRRGA